MIKTPEQIYQAEYFQLNKKRIMKKRRGVWKKKIADYQKAYRKKHLKHYRRYQKIYRKAYYEKTGR